MARRACKVQGILYAENEEEHSEATGTIDVGARLSARSSLQRAADRWLLGYSAIGTARHCCFRHPRIVASATSNQDGRPSERIVAFAICGFQDFLVGCAASHLFR